MDELQWNSGRAARGRTEGRPEGSALEKKRRSPKHDPEYPPDTRHLSENRRARRRGPPPLSETIDLQKIVERYAAAPSAAAGVILERYAPQIRSARHYGRAVGSGTGTVEIAQPEMLPGEEGGGVGPQERAGGYIISLPE